MGAQGRIDDATEPHDVAGVGDEDGEISPTVWATWGV
jgi:hypothetical protein